MSVMVNHVYVKSEDLIFIYLIWISEFKSVTKEVCKLPSFFSTALFRKIDVTGTGFVSRYYANVVIVGIILI